MNSSPFSKPVATAIGIILGISIHQTQAATISWTNINGGVWGSATNWSPNIVPRYFDDVQITAAGTYAVTVNSNYVMQSLTVGGPGGVQQVTNSAQTMYITNSTVVNANGQLSLGAGTLIGGPLTLQGTLNWAGSTVLMPVTVTASGVLNFSGSANYIEGPLTNSGTINWSGVSASLSLYNNHGIYTGVIYNQASGLFNLQNDQNLSGGYGFESFVNAGTVRKMAGGGVSTFTVAFTNSGTVDAQSGTIRFSNGGNINGTYNTASGAIIEFYAGNFVHTGAVNVTGSGVCRQNGGNVTLNDRITKFVLLSGNVALSSTFQTNGAIHNLQLDGSYLVGTNVVTGTLGFNGGGTGSASPLTVAPGAVLNFNGAAAYIESPLTNSGTINWSGAGLTVYNNGGIYTGVIQNQASGLFNLQSDQNLSAGYGPEVFRNNGTVRKSAGLGISTFSVIFTNAGLVDAQSGMIRFSAGGNLGSIYNTVSGSIIEFYSGNFVQNGQMTITGGGICRQNGAAVTLSDRIAGFPLISGNVTLAGNFQTNGTIQNLQLDGATLLGTNVVSGTLGMNGGSVAQASPLTVAPGAVLNFNGAGVSINAPLTNYGTINWSGAGLTVNNNNGIYKGFIHNQLLGLFNLQSDQTLSVGYGGELFRNNGTVRKTAGLGVSTISLVFSNSGAGVVDAQSGTIRFSGGGNLGGVYNTVSGSIIELYSGNFAHDSLVTVTGAGICRLNGTATLTLYDRISGFLLTSGNVALTPTFQTNGTIQNLQLDGASLLGTNVVTGTLGMNGGSLPSPSPLTVAPGGVLNLNGATVSINAPLTNSGTINCSGTGGLTVSHNNAAYTGVIYNQGGGLFNLQNDQSLSTGGYGFELFNNAGTVRKTAGLGLTTINIPFVNTGILDAQSGTIRFTGPYSQTSGTMNFGITSLAYFGKISFSANAPFTGVLSVNFNGSYFPSAGDSFGLVSYASRTGIFTNQTLPPAAQWQTNYSATTFTLTALSVNSGAGSVTLAPIPSRSINPGSVLLITNTATESNPSLQITYSLTAAPAGATIGSTSGILQWTAPFNLAGSNNLFTVKATDNGTPPASDSKSFNVYVSSGGTAVIITPISYATGRFTMQISGPAGPDYIIHASTNFTNWTGVSTSTPSVLPFTFVDTNAGAFPRRFYRVVLGP